MLAGLGSGVLRGSCSPGTHNQGKMLKASEICPGPRPPRGLIRLTCQLDATGWPQQPLGQPPKLYTLLPLLQGETVQTELIVFPWKTLLPPPPHLTGFDLGCRSPGDLLAPPTVQRESPILPPHTSSCRGRGFRWLPCTRGEVATPD